MKQRDFLKILSVTEKLKCNTRHCYTSTGRHESVAEHSWRLALMAMLLTPEFPHADMDKVIRICLIHDLGEAFTGDIPSFQKTAEDTRKEDALFDAWVDTLPEPTRGGICRFAFGNERTGNPGGQNLQGSGQDGGGDPAQ